MDKLVAAHDRHVEIDDGQIDSAQVLGEQVDRLATIFRFHDGKTRAFQAGAHHPPHRTIVVNDQGGHAGECGHGPQHPVDSPGDVAAGEGFGYEFQAPQVKAADAVLKRVIGRNEQDRGPYLACAVESLGLPLAELLAAGKAVHSRHVDIHGNQVGWRLHPRQGRERLNAVTEGDDSVPGRFQLLLDNGSHGGAIVNHHHCQRFGCRIRGLFRPVCHAVCHHCSLSSVYSGQTDAVPHGPTPGSIV